MPTLTTLTLDADGTIDTTNISHNAGTGPPYNTHCNDTPDGGSSDFIEHNAGLVDGTFTAWFSLSDVDADFSSMNNLNIDVDLEVVGTVLNDTVTLTARIFAADNDTGNPLTDETITLGDQTDGTRVQRNVSFAGLTGSEAQWNAAHIRFSFTYDRVTSPDTYNLRLYGCDIDREYTASAGETPVTATHIANISWLQEIEKNEEVSIS